MAPVGRWPGHRGQAWGRCWRRWRSERRRGVEEVVRPHPLLLHQGRRLLRAGLVRHRLGEEDEEDRRRKGEGGD